MPQPTEVELVVVGAGATGCVFAWILAEAGKKVLLLEAGPATLRRVPFSVLSASRRRKLAQGPLAFLSGQPRQAKCYAWAEDPEHFVSDRLHPFESIGPSPFVWIRGRQPGGRMVIREHGRKFPRFAEQDFEGWPIEVSTLEAHYARVEKLLKIFTPTTTPLGMAVASELGLLDSELSQLPTGDFSPFLEACLAHERIEFLPSTAVSRLETSADASRVAGLELIDTRSGERRMQPAKHVVLCAGTLESTRILLNSATQKFPTGLANSSGCLGRFLVDHVKTSVRARVCRQAASNFFPTGARGDFYLPEMSRGFGVQINFSSIENSSREIDISLKTYAPMTSVAENRASISENLIDAFGVPALAIDVRHGPDDLARAAEQAQYLAAMIPGAETQLASVGLACHESGTARMGRDPKTSVLDPGLRSWDLPNLYLADGACLPTQACLNPTLTLMALASRAADGLLEELR